MSSPESEFVPDVGAYHLYDYYRTKPDPPYKLFDIVIAKQDVRANAVFKEIKSPTPLLRLSGSLHTLLAAIRTGPPESKNESGSIMDEHNQNALEVLVNQGAEAAAKFMFQHPSETTDSGSPRKMSYAEMRSYYG